MDAGWRELLIAVLLLLTGALGAALLRAGRRNAVAAPAVAPDPPRQELIDGELRALRLELDEVRDTVARLEQEVAELKAAKRVSPQYEEALQLAGRGLEAADIAQRCGISVAEAELVRALGRG